MGNFLFLYDFRVAEKHRGFDPYVGYHNPAWYFSDAYRNSGSGGGWYWEFTVESGFPYCAAIHQDHFDQGNSATLLTEVRNLMIGFRRFIERNCEGACLYSEKVMDYDYLYRPATEEYRNLYQDGYSRHKVKHGYRLFNFEEAADQMLFSLRFADLVSPISNRHPSRGGVSEETIEHAAREPYTGSR